MKVINRTLAPMHLQFCDPAILLPGQEGTFDMEAMNGEKNKRYKARVEADVVAGTLEEVKAGKAETEAKPTKPAR